MTTRPNWKTNTMKTKTKPLPTVKTYRPTLRAFTSAVFSANAIAEREARDEKHFAGPGESHSPHLGRRAGDPGFPLASCIAYTDSGNICGVTPAPFLDLVRGGMVCADHKPERGPA